MFGIRQSWLAVYAHFFSLLLFWFPYLFVFRRLTPLGERTTCCYSGYLFFSTRHSPRRTKDWTPATASCWTWCQCCSTWPPRCGWTRWTPPTSTPPPADWSSRRRRGSRRPIRRRLTSPPHSPSQPQWRYVSRLPSLSWLPIGPQRGGAAQCHQSEGGIIRSFSPNLAPNRMLAWEAEVSFQTLWSIGSQETLTR